MIKKIAYIGIAVKDIELAKESFMGLLDGEIVREGTSDIDQVKNCYFTLGEDTFELIEPYAPSSPVAGFIKNRGEGIQYVGLEVTDLDDMVEELKMRGVRFTTEKPVEYPNGSRWAFIHPKAMHGVLLALIENPV
jgi:methylmalonyl-CoA/ethylmalonyl-CoA epimerase